MDDEVPNLLAGYLNRKQTAKALRKSEKTISRMFNQVDGLAYVELGNEKLTTPEFIQEYLRARTRRPNRRGRKAP